MDSAAVSLLELLQRGASDAIIRKNDKLWYLTSEELLNHKITDLMFAAIPLAKCAEITFKYWDKRIQANIVKNTTKLEKFMKFIREIEQDVYKMSQGSIEFLKSFFQMDSYLKLRLSTSNEVEIFWSSNDSIRKQSWRHGAVQKLKYLVEKGPNVPAQIFIASVSLFLIAWSVYDLKKIFEDCGILEKMIKREKEEYVSRLNILEGILSQILVALENQSNDTFNALLSILATTTADLVRKIDDSCEGIRNETDRLSNKESNRRTVEVVSALSSVASLAVTIYDWNYWSAPQRAVGLLFSGTTAASVVTSHMSAEKLRQTREILEQVLIDLKTLDERLEPISLAARQHYGENIEYAILRNQFDTYRESIGEFREIFTR